MTEKDLWNRIKDALPRTRFVRFRIESRTMQGLPDAQVIYRDRLYMLELKVVKTAGEAIKIRDSQRAFAAQLWNVGFTDYYIIVGYGREFGYIKCEELLDFDRRFTFEDIRHTARPINRFSDFILTREEMHHVLCDQR